MNIHICLFDKDCLIDWWQFGMPLRIYWGDDKYWTIPFTGNRDVKHWDEEYKDVTVLGPDIIDINQGDDT